MVAVPTTDDLKVLVAVLNQFASQNHVLPTPDHTRRAVVEVPVAATTNEPGLSSTQELKGVKKAVRGRGKKKVVKADVIELDGDGDDKF
ncbi:hypothetical protein SBOR_8172 [Sclerotinia borealis F-4128]|uniref:Uncharacterized protein n=1 Tax=Sclerotinia borealis (strain F-4128) TaxID=1432307 RepID=W9C9A3_SCLBF|nr:hypothetical protein SBOR_8172 [Sclerotinia borealis F-4128]